MNGKKIDGHKLRDLREKNLLSASRLAMKSELNATTILDIEKGKQGMVRFDTVIKIAAGFGMSPQDLLAIIEDHETAKA